MSSSRRDTASGSISATLPSTTQCLLLSATGINTFIAMSVCEQILSSGLSFKTIDVGRGPEKEGALLALFQLTFRDGVSGLKEAMFRTGAGGNIITLLATVFIFVLVNYFQVNASVPIRSFNE